MTTDGAPPPRRQPSRPVSRPPRLRPSGGPRGGGPVSGGPAGGGSDGGGPDGRPGALLRTLAGALLAVGAVALGVAVLLVLRPGGDDARVAAGEGAVREAPGGAAPTALPQPQPPAPVPAPEAPAPAPAPAPPDATVTVLGVGGADGAGPAAERLRGEGWTVRLVAAYRGDPPSATTVFHVPGREGDAALLAAATGAAAVRPAPTSLSEGDLTLVVVP